LRVLDSKLRARIAALIGPADVDINEALTPDDE
jgi:hypothetical protein